MRTHQKMSVAVLLAMGAIATGCAEPGVYTGFQLSVSSAPPPPRIVFVDEPRMVMDYSSGVYVLDEGDPGYDMFRYGRVYYIQRDGYWYRADSYRGSFVAIDVHTVPRQVFRVSGSHWRHHPHDDRDRDRG